MFPHEDGCPAGTGGVTYCTVSLITDLQNYWSKYFFTTHVYTFSWWVTIVVAGFECGEILVFFCRHPGLCEYEEPRQLLVVGDFEVESQHGEVGGENP